MTHTKTKIEAATNTTARNATKHLATTALACAALCMPALASAQQITLKSSDGEINITGELQSFEDGSYIVESVWGPLRVVADRVECFGDGCPDLNPTVVATGAVTWDVSLWGKRRAFTEHVEKLAELVSDKTDGQFQLNLSYGDLSPSRENLDGIAAGKFEMAQFCAGYHREKNPSITVLELPFLGVGTLEQEVAVSLAVYDHPATRQDMARWNAQLLMPSPLPQYNLMGNGRLPTSVESFKGMNVRATGGIGDAIEALGGSLVNLPATKVQRALDTGFVDAVSFAPHAHMAFGTIQSGLWWTTNLNPGTVNCPIAFNTDAFERLPTEYRDAVLGAVDEALDHYIANYNGATMEAWGPALDKAGVILLTINDDVMSSIRSTVAGPAAKAWIAENEALGLPAQDLYNLVMFTLAGGS